MLSDGVWQSIPSRLYRKYRLSANAQYCVSMMIDFNHPEVTGYQQGIVPHTFPPQVKSSPGSIDPWLTAPRCTDGFCGSGGCNSGLSASGKITYYFDGSHDQLRANFWDHTAKTYSTHAIGSDIDGSLGVAKDVDGWLTPRVDLTTSSTFVYPRGSSNSDRIVSILANWSDYAGLSWGGNNLFVVNWKDKEAVMATNHSNELAAAGWKKDVGGPLPPGIKYWYADPGDFWLAGGPAGCYEAIDGSWIDVATGQQVVVASMQPSSRLGNAPATMRGTLSVYNLSGACVGAFDAASLHRRIPTQLGRGAYLAYRQGIAGASMMLHDGVWAQ